MLPEVILEYKSSGHILSSRRNIEVRRGNFGAFSTKWHKHSSINAIKIQENLLIYQTVRIEAQNFVLLATLHEGLKLAYVHISNCTLNPAF